MFNNELAIFFTLLEVFLLIVIATSRLINLEGIGIILYCLFVLFKYSKTSFKVTLIPHPSIDSCAAAIKSFL